MPPRLAYSARQLLFDCTIGKHSQETEKSLSGFGCLVVTFSSLLSSTFLVSLLLLACLLTPVFPRHFDTLFPDPRKLSQLKNFPNYLKLDSSIYASSCSSALTRLIIFGHVEKYRRTYQNQTSFKIEYYSQVHCLGCQTNCNGFLHVYQEILGSNLGAI